MKQNVISVENLSKEYNLDFLYEYYTLRDLIKEAPTLLAKKLSKKEKKQRFWALKNVSFTVKKGEVLGIIGRNGAGKSTLLKILARIVSPTSGKVILRGKVASMLEVGTGFHQELTGRENIYLNGAILGMKRAEINKKFKDIVEFSEIGKFLDTPVKKYSSGMQVRLAFSVAAHLDPEILLLDEVLAVGDMSFQRKSLRKMNSIARDEGKTVIFVSHNMTAVDSLCSRVALLEEGELVSLGKTRATISKYIKDFVVDEKVQDLKNISRAGNSKLIITDFWMEDNFGKRTSKVRTGSNCKFIFKFMCPSGYSQKNVDFGFSVKSEADQPLFLHYLSFTNQQLKKCPPKGIFSLSIDKFPLTIGQYKVGFRALVDGKEADYVPYASDFDVIEGDFYNTGTPINQTHSPFYVPGSWSIESK